jgi:hypothetical protein
MKTTVVNIKQNYCDHYIGRGHPKWNRSPFANPYRIGGLITREISIAWYTHWLYSQPDLMLEAREQLTGKRLGCWCKPEACHGDVLARVCELSLEEFDVMAVLLMETIDSPWQWRRIGDEDPAIIIRLARLCRAGIFHLRPAHGGDVWRWANLHWMPDEVVELATVRCIYCGCHEDRPCSVVTRSSDGHGVHPKPCSWIAPAVCDSPGCFALHAWEQITRDRRQPSIASGVAMALAQDIRRSVTGQDDASQG